MPIRLSNELIHKLRGMGVSTSHRPGSTLPDDSVFEPPCSFKMMSISHSISIGAFSYGVNGFFFGCRIGRYCSIGEQVQIGRHSHPMHWISTSPFFFNSIENILDLNLPDGIELTAGNDFHKNTPRVVSKLTIIENDVWIGHGAFILPGVHIGNGAVIGAKSVVTRDVPPYAVVAGSPARIKRYRFTDSQITKLVESKWWEYAPWQLKGAQIDNIMSFVNTVSGLRSIDEATYAPSLVKLTDLAVESF